MKKLKVFLTLFAVILLLVFNLTACAPTKPVDVSTYPSKVWTTTDYFKTASTLIVYDDFSVSQKVLDFSKATNEIDELLSSIETLLSVSISTSEIARFNALNSGEKMEISQLTAEIFQTAKQVYLDTDKIFDPTVMLLVDLWGLSPRFTEYDYKPTQPYDRDYVDGSLPLPQSKYIEAFRSLVGLDKIVLSQINGKYYLTKNTQSVTIDGVKYNACLDLGGIGKGYAVDAVQSILNKYGFKYGYFSCGESSMYILQSSNQAAVGDGSFEYNLGISKPRKGSNPEKSMCLTLKTKNASVSSSGDYMRKYVLDGIVYSHIINPFAGYPMNVTPNSATQSGIATVTVTGGTAAYDDGTTTALCLMSVSEAIDYINANLTDRNVLFVIYNSQYDYYEIVGNVPTDRYTVQDSSYKVAYTLDSQGKIIYTGNLAK